jgi:hypothetical protein
LELAFWQAPNNSEGLIRATAKVSWVYHSEKLSEEESRQVVENYQSQLLLTPAQTTRWAGKRYLVLVEVREITSVPPYAIDRSAYGNMDDWLPVGEIDSIVLKCG